MQGVGRQRGGVTLGRDQAAERCGDVVRCHPRGVEKGLSLHELDHGAAGRPRGATALGVEARLGDAIPLDAHRHADQIAAGGAAGGAGVRRAGEGAKAARGVEVVLEEQESED